MSLAVTSALQSGSQCRVRSRRRRPPSLTRSTSSSASTCSRLADYRDESGRAREVIAASGASGSVLVIDRDAATLRDRRLVAHLAADEPRENAALVCRLYIADPSGRWCRRVDPRDLELDGLGEPDVDVAVESSLIRDLDGNLYRIGRVFGEGALPQLRWTMRKASAADGAWEVVSLREVIAALESYEPLRTLTARAIANHHDEPRVSVTRLRDELDRIGRTPIVLNRGLREAILDAVDRRGLSLSEIALRCGMVKLDRRGRPSGESSWLARRVGLMPEGGQRVSTPWVHSEVLGLIARKGLGIPPREVELG